MSRLRGFFVVVMLAISPARAVEVTLTDVLQLEPDPSFGDITTTFTLTADSADVIAGNLTGANTVVEIILNATGGPLSGFIDGAAYGFDENVFAAFPVVDSGCKADCWVQASFNGSGTSVLSTTNGATVETLEFATNGSQLTVSYPELGLPDTVFNVAEDERICFDDAGAVILADIDNSGTVDVGDQLFLIRHLLKAVELNCSESSRANIYPGDSLDYTVDLLDLQKFQLMLLQ